MSKFCVWKTILQHHYVCDQAQLGVFDVAVGAFRASLCHLWNQSQEWYAKTRDLLSRKLIVVLGQALPDLLYATIDDLQSGLAAGTFTSVDLVKVWEFSLLFRSISILFFQRHTWLV